MGRQIRSKWLCRQLQGFLPRSQPILVVELPGWFARQEPRLAYRLQYGKFIASPKIKIGYNPPRYRPFRPLSRGNGNRTMKINSMLLYRARIFGEHI
jgi:hypothetical protein